jgi:hypothetical protein
VSGGSSSAEPLLAGEGAPARDAWSDDGNLEDDFKVRLP